MIRIPLTGIASSILLTKCRRTHQSGFVRVQELLIFLDVLCTQIIISFKRKLARLDRLLFDKDDFKAFWQIFMI